MSHLKTLIAVLAAFALFTVPFSAFAAYGQLKVPPGWSPPKNIGNSATFKTGPAANQNTYNGSTVLTNAALEIGGQAVQVPVSMRIAANASVIAATYAFGNPLIFGALALGSAAYLYYQEKGLTAKDGVWLKKDPQVCTSAPCYEYSAVVNGLSGPFRPTPDGAFNSAAALYPSSCGGGCTRKFTLISCSVSSCSYDYEESVINPNDGTVRVSKSTGVASLGSRDIPPQTAVPVPIGDVEFHTIMDPVPVPKAVPKELPDIEWPVEQPAINPSPLDIPDAFPSPVSPPASKPLWVPTGDPVRNPTTTNPDGTPKPDTWTQPGKDVKPSGTPSDPWRVDVTDAPKTKGDPSPNTDTPIPTTSTPTPTTTEITTCGLPGKPKCLIDETGTKSDKGDTLTAPKTALDATENARKASIDSAHQIQRPEWTFSFQLPSGCTPFITGLKGVVLDVCKYREPIHDLLSMVWAGATVFCLAGMVGRTIRES